VGLGACPFFHNLILQQIEHFRVRFLL
jgi:hypothetical protein